MARSATLKCDKHEARIEWLRLLYTDSGLTIRQLARLFSVEPQTVTRWLRDAQIRRRPLG